MEIDAHDEKISNVWMYRIGIGYTDTGVRMYGSE
jgi:hypothetical protein